MTVLVDVYVVGTDPKDRHTVERYYKRLILPNKSD